MNKAAQALLSEFECYLREQRQYSAHTLANYRRDLRDFSAYLARSGIVDWSQVRAHHVRDYAATRHRTGLSGRSVQRALSALRSYFRYLLKHGRIEHNPAQDVRAPQSARKLPALLDVDQVDRLLAFEPDTVLALRDCAIMELLYSCGLRLAELVALDVDDLDRAQAELKVSGKAKKARVVPVGRLALAALQHWLQARARICTAGERALFVARHGRRLSHRAVQQRLRQWALRQGLEHKLHPHMLRHCFASHLLESSGELRAVQELLGHANISTTQIYTHLDFQHLAKVYDEAHPRARKSR